MTCQSKKNVFCDLLLYLFCLTLCVFWYVATLYKIRSKIILKNSIFGKYVFKYEFLYLLLIDLCWDFRVVERSRELFFDYLKTLKIVFILCILGLIVVCLGFYLDFWGLDLWDLMIYWFLAGIFDDVWFWVLVEIV